MTYLKNKRCLVVIPVLAVLVGMTNIFGMPVSAQGSTPTPNPTMGSLIATQKALSAKVNEMSVELENIIAQTDFTSEKAVFTVERALFEKTAPLLVLSLFFAALGIGGFVYVRRELNTMIRRRLENEIYRLDPTFLPIWIPDQNFDQEYKRLHLSGFRNITKYSVLGKQLLNGVVILPVHKTEDETLFMDFVETYQPNPLRTAFVLYSRAKVHRIEETTLLRYNNTTVATNPTALSRAILDVGRGLKPSN